MDIGILYIFAVESLGVYRGDPGGLVVEQQVFVPRRLAFERWLIGYEIPLGLSILGIVLIAGSLDLNTIINWQDKHVWGYSCSRSVPAVLDQCLCRDEPVTLRLAGGGEQELVGGFHTEYSAMKFGMFFLGEYLNIITVSYHGVILFFGGWHLPFITSREKVGFFWSLVKCGIMIGKVGVMIGFMMWVRWALPRFRYDTLMDLAWEVADSALVGESRGHCVDRSALVSLVVAVVDWYRRCLDLPRFVEEFYACVPMTRAEATDASEAEPDGEDLSSQIFTGLVVTARHMAGVAFFNKAITVQCRKSSTSSPNYRGVPRLNKDEQGAGGVWPACSVRPPAPPTASTSSVRPLRRMARDREKYCRASSSDKPGTSCGMCEEACPSRAIELTGLYDLTGLSREQMIFDKAKLLSVADVTKDAEPMRYGKGPTGVPTTTAPRESKPVSFLSLYRQGNVQLWTHRQTI